MKRRTTWIAVGAAAIAVTVAIVVSVVNWHVVGNSGIDTNGWIALALGVLATLAVGIGLMALVFISSRHGYDDLSGTGRSDDR